MSALFGAVEYRWNVRKVRCLGRLINENHTSTNIVRFRSYPCCIRTCFVIVSERVVFLEHQSGSDGRAALYSAVGGSEHTKFLFLPPRIQGGCPNTTEVDFKGVTGEPERLMILAIAADMGRNHRIFKFTRGPPRRVRNIIGHRHHAQKQSPPHLVRTAIPSVSASHTVRHPHRHAALFTTPRSSSRCAFLCSLKTEKSCTYVVSDVVDISVLRKGVSARGYARF